MAFSYRLVQLLVEQPNPFLSPWNLLCLSVSFKLRWEMLCKICYDLVRNFSVATDL